MKVRVVKFEKNQIWYEVQVKILGLFWIDADLYRQGFPSVFSDLEKAMSSLDLLKKKKQTKKVVCEVDF